MCVSTSYLILTCGIWGSFLPIKFHLPFRILYPLTTVPEKHELRLIRIKGYADINILEGTLHMQINKGSLWGCLASAVVIGGHCSGNMLVRIVVELPESQHTQSCGQPAHYIRF